MKIIANRGAQEIAYIQNRDMAYIRQFYSQNVEYDNRSGDFKLITDLKLIKVLKEMDYILDYCELMSLSQEKLDQRYCEIKDLYNARNTFKNGDVYREDGLEDLYSEYYQQPKNTYELCSDPLFYSLEQLREFILIRQGRSKIDIPAIIMEEEFKLELEDNYTIYGTTNPQIIVLVNSRDNQPIELDKLSAKSIKTAIWLNYVRQNNIFNGQSFDASLLSSDYQMTENQLCLYIKTERQNLKNRDVKRKEKKK